jgi:hypothetical protein
MSILKFLARGRMLALTAALGSAVAFAGTGTAKADSLSLAWGVGNICVTRFFTSGPGPLAPLGSPCHTWDQYGNLVFGYVD